MMATRRRTTVPAERRKKMEAARGQHPGFEGPLLGPGQPGSPIRGQPGTGMGGMIQEGQVGAIAPQPAPLQQTSYAPGALGLQSQWANPINLEMDLEALNDQIADLKQSLGASRMMGPSKWRSEDHLWQLMDQQATLQAKIQAQQQMPEGGWQQQQGQGGAGWGDPQFYGFGAQDIEGFEATERERLMDQVGSVMAARGMSQSSMAIDLSTAAAAQARQYALPYMESQFARKTDWEMARWQQGEHAYEFEQEMQYRRQQMQMEARLRRSAMKQQWEVFTNQLETQDYWRLQDQLAGAQPGEAPPQGYGGERRGPQMRGGVPSEFYLNDPQWMGGYNDWQTEWDEYFRGARSF